MNREAVRTAGKAADSALLLTDPSGAARALKAWRRTPVLAIDTEFVRERTYYANLGLVQASDGQTVWLVDPVAGDTLAPVRAMLEDASILKLIHSPSEDLEVLGQSVGATPAPMVDTQLACAMLGQPLQLAYHAAADWLLGVSLEKGETRSNWTRRPLRPAQLHYAAQDVSFLPEMWRELERRLAARDRIAWLEEDCAALARATGTSVPDQQAWERIRGAGRLSGSGLAILQALAAWREREARERNLPRGFIVPDPVLLAIASRPITTVNGLEDLADLHPKARQRLGDRLVDIVNEVLQSGRELEEIKPLSKSERRALGQARDLVTRAAGKLEVEPALLASKRELESLLRSDPQHWPQKFSGWRREYLRPALEKLKS